jgi:hypothetical protein
LYERPPSWWAGVISGIEEKSMSDIKETLKHAGHKVAESAKAVGHTIGAGVSQAAGWVKDHTGTKDRDEVCGAAKSSADIVPHMDVFASCGKKVGVVDHLEGGTIKLTQKDSPDGLHHFIPTGWVVRVDEHVHLSKNSVETAQGWALNAAACSSCGT